LALLACSSPAPTPAPTAIDDGRAEARARYEEALERLDEYEGAHGATLATRNGPLHYLRWGDSGLPLIWLHGTYSSAYEIAEVAEQLVLDGYQVVGVDYYGHGATPLPAHEVSLYHAADDVAELMDALEIDAAVIGGWSRGGMLSTAFYSQYPERVLGLILADGGAWSLERFTDGLGKEGVLEWVDRWFDPDTGDMVLPTYETPFELFFERWKSGEDQSWLDHFATLTRGGETADGRWTSFRPSVMRWLDQDGFEVAVRGIERPTLGSLFLWSSSVLVPRAVYRNLAVPMLVLDPTGDFMDMTEQNRALEQLHPELVELVLYEDTGHDVRGQRPQRFLADVQRLLGRAGWDELTLADFVNVNGAADTWTEVDGSIVCTGVPLGGARTQHPYTNFELSLDWKHHTHAGNSGVFLWCPESAFTDLPPGQLPRSGIEVQVLDLGYEENWESSKGAPSNWFTSHGDVFPVGASSMVAATPTIEYGTGESRYTVGNPTSTRSFPTERLVHPAGEWNHYHVRAIDGEVRLSVNGKEVNGGTECAPAEGYLALEAEGALVEYRNLRIRTLP
jgi:pimeloyl-ACP methyl ester carboxylesterase